jgi:hypothetical protein
MYFLIAETKALSLSLHTVDSILTNYTKFFMEFKNNGRFIEQLMVARELNLKNKN